MQNTIKEARRLLRTVLLLRLAVVGCVLGAGAVVFGGSRDGGPLVPWLLLLGMTALFTGASWAGLRRERASTRLAAAQLLADLAVATGVVHLSGGFDSPFTFLYVLSVLSGAALWGRWGALGMGSAASAVYGYLAVLQLSGRIAPPHTWDTALAEGIAQDSALVHVLLQVGFFHATAAIAAHMADRARRRGAELAAKELALREERVNTDTIIQSMRSGLITVNEHGEVVLLNRAGEDILGCRREQVAGHHFATVLGDRSAEFSRGLEAALGRGETPTRLEATVIAEGREPCPIGVSLSLLRTVEGEPRGVVAIFQDLSEVKQMEERVRRADRLATVGEMAGAIAHEIRNPLASISGSMEMLAAELVVEGEHRRLLEMVLRETNHLKRITNDFLAYGRLRPKEVAPVEVRQLLREVTYLLRHHEACHAGIEIRTEEPPADVWALWDGEQIQQALVNVGVNALEAMPSGGSLTVHAAVVPWETPAAPASVPARLPRAVRLALEDTGPGVPAEYLRRVFEPFFTSKPKGTGLGLAIVARIVEDHGGLLDLRSHPGEGTCFTLTLPGAAGGWDGGTATAEEAEEVLTTQAQG